MTTHQIMAIAGQKTIEDVERYTAEYRPLEANF
jgi:hypothetical protein